MCVTFRKARDLLNTSNPITEYINNNSKKGFKNIKWKKRYIKNKEVFVILKKQNLVYEARKYPKTCSVESIDELSDKLIGLKRLDMLETEVTVTINSGIGREISNPGIGREIINSCIGRITINSVIGRFTSTF